MPNWKKIIVSGSGASLSSAYIEGNLTASAAYLTSASIGHLETTYEGDGSSLYENITVTVVNDGGNKYAFNGVTAPYLSIQRPSFYRFDLSDSSNSNHPFAFRLPDDTSYTIGVTTVGTAGNEGAYVELDIDFNASSSLKYYCTVHGNGMGNDIQVNDLFDLRASGSFSGSFEGDGTNLTGVASPTGSYTGSFTGSILGDVIGTASIADFATTSSHTAGTASIADLATTSSHTAGTASIADLATTASYISTASFADNATTASAIFAGAAFPTTNGLEGQGLALNSSGDFIFGDFFGTGSTKKLNQSVAASTWSFNHSLDELYPIIQVYNGDGNQLIPERVEAVDANNVRLYFAENTSGVAAAMVGGMGISASYAVTASHALNVPDTASHALTSVSSSIADELSQLATASHALTSVTSSHVVGTASFANNATTASFPERGFIDGTVSNNIITLNRGDGTTITLETSVSGSVESASIATVATTVRNGGSGSFSGSFEGDATNLNVNPFPFTGSGEMQGQLIIESFNDYIDDYVESYFAGTAISSNGDIALTGSIFSPYINANSFTGSLSGSATSASFAETASYFGGTVTSASFAETASYFGGTVTSASFAETASYFGGTVTSASFAETASFALNADGGGFPFSGSALITGSLIVSASTTSDIIDFTNSTGVSGSFSGSYQGDGSGLTGIALESSTIISQTFSSVTSVTASHNFGSENVVVQVYDGSNNLIVPSNIRVLDSNEVGVDFASTRSGRVTVSKGGHLVSGSIETAQTASYGNNFIASNLYVEGSANLVASQSVNNNTSSGSLSFWNGSQTEYDALGSYDNNTIYFVVA